MLEKILDKYYLRKVVKDVIGKMREKYYLSFYIIENKHSIDILFNYKEEGKIRLMPFKVLTIRAEDIISIITDYEKFINYFEEILINIIKKEK